MNQEEKERIQFIFLRYMQGKATDAERSELSAQLKAEPDNALWVEWLDEIYSAGDTAGEYDAATWQPVLDDLIRQNRERDAASIAPRTKVVPMWRKLAVAASILLVAGVTTYFLFFNKTVNDQPPVAETTEIKAPQTNRATIQLADGTTVYLDSAANGQLAVQNNVKLVKTADGKIAYSRESGVGSREPVPMKSGPIQYNTLTNPRGSRVIDMLLSDGTHVWLNAGSSITYPVAFAGSERKIMITGEAYFEVARTKAREGFTPFIVDVDGKQTVEVLGTHFNINSYADEGAIRTTLLEGKVKVSTKYEVRNTGLSAGSEQSVILQPGEQAAITTNYKLQTTNKINIDEVMAWKNGYFHFIRADIPTVMRQLARWYDLEIDYAGTIAVREFGGEMQRDLPLSSIIRLLEKGNIHLKLNGKKLTVLP